MCIQSFISASKINELEIALLNPEELAKAVMCFSLYVLKAGSLAQDFQNKYTTENVKNFYSIEITKWEIIQFGFTL